MKANILVLFMGVLMIFGCDNDDIQRAIDGQYVGTFQRGGNSSNVELTLNDTNFSGESEIVKFPAICNGNYSISGRTITFENQCAWTAEFDWSLETVLKYIDYFFMPLFAPFFVRILYRS